MQHSRVLSARLWMVLWVAFLPTLGHARKKSDLPIVRWTSGAAGCSFERTDDGRLRWTMSDKNLDVTLLVDSQELAKSRHRFYRVFGVYSSVTYKGPGNFEFPADLRMSFMRHHEVVEGFLDPTELSQRLQNDIDTKVFETEKQIKKNPERVRRVAVITRIGPEEPRGTNTRRPTSVLFVFLKS